MARKKLQYQALSQVINVPVPPPAVPISGYQDWPNLIWPRARPVQEGFIANAPFVPVVTIIKGASFSDWEGARLKPPLEGFITQAGLPPVVITEAATFQDWDVPSKLRGFQEGYVTQTNSLGPAQTPPWFVFSDFGVAPRAKLVQTDIQPTTLPIVAAVVQPYIFGQFDQPRFKQTIQQDWSSSPQPQAITLTPAAFTGFLDFGIPTPHKVIQPDISDTLQPQVVIVQSYIFSSFEQPQFKRQLIDLPVQFTSVQIAQPYVFSRFEQPQFKRLLDQSLGFITPTIVQSYVFSKFEQPTVLKLLSPDTAIQFPPQTYVVVAPPVFTGFNDFGLTQQTVGTQQKQDGSYSQFTVLPMPFIASVYSFTGFSDFSALLQSKQNRPDLYSDSVIFEITPAGPIPFPEFATGGGKRWQYDPRMTKNFEGISSNLSEATYETEDKRLVVKFKTYEFEHVDPEKAKGLFKAKSPGKFFHGNIKGKHPTTRIK